MHCSIHNAVRKGLLSSPLRKHHRFDGATESVRAGSSQHPVIPSHLAVIALCDAPASHRTVHRCARVPDHLHSETIHSLFTTQLPTTRADFERTPVDSGVLRRLSSGSCPIYLGVPRTQTHSLYTACMPHSRCSPLHRSLNALLSGTTEYGWACS